MMRRPEDNNKEGESPLVEDINLKAAFPNECSGRPTVDKKVDVSPSSS